MDEIVWSGWLQKKGGDSSAIVNRLSFIGISGNKERYFVLTRKNITYYAPPGQSSRGSIFIEIATPKALSDLGFLKKGSIDLAEVLHMKKSEEDQSLMLVTSSGRTYEISGFNDSASNLDMSSFEGCLHNLGIKFEVGMDSIYEGNETVESGVGLRSTDYTAVTKTGKGAAVLSAKTAAATAAANAAANVSSPTLAAAATSIISSTTAPTSPTPAAPPTPLTGKDLLKRPASHQAHDDHMSDMVTNRERTIDEMKIQTMYKMVEDIEVVANGRNLEKKVLYLTNKQCNMFDDVGILRCLQALDLGKPKCVIRLLSAERGVAQYTVHTETRGYVLSSQQYGCDIGPHDAARTQMQLDLFMKTCILPLAKQTHALIICSGCNDDALAASLERVVVPEQARLGKNCPFKVLTFVWSFEVHYKAYLGEGIAGKVASECLSWGLRLDAISQFLAEYLDRNIQRSDLIQSASHIIIFESFEDGKTLVAPSKAFQAKLMDAMTTQLPSIAIQTLLCDYSTVADLCRRNIPILFLDTRERAITTKLLSTGATRVPVTHLAQCSEAFPRILAEHLSQFPKNPDGTITFKAKRSLLHLAFRMILSGVDAMGAQTLIDYDNSSAVALVHSALMFGIDSTESDVSCVPLYARISELKRAEQDSAGAGSTRGLIPVELAREAAHFLNARLRTNVTRAKLAQVKKWLQQNPPGCKLDHNRVLATRWEDYLQKNLSFADANGGEYVLESDAISFLSILDILSSQLTFSGSIFDLDEVNRTISSVVKIDRLPKQNSMEALLSLQDAWDHVDAYHHHATFYKILTKLSYALLLLAGIATSIVAISREKVDESETDDNSSNSDSENSMSQYAILAITLLVTTVVGYVNFMNPAQRWQQLRGAAMNMESEIWMFRTRAGEYRLSSESSDGSGDADALLQERIQEIKNGVLEGADMKKTSFFGKFASINLHQQHPPTYRQIQETKSKSYFNSCRSAIRNSVLEHQDNDGDKIQQRSFGSPRVRAGYSNVTVSSDRERTELDETDEYSAPVLEMTSEEGTSVDELLSWLGTRFVRSPGTDGVKDNHYLPVLPGNYVQFRIEKALKFYKKRIPLCNRTRHIGQLLSTIGSLAGVVLAFLNKVEYTVITAIGTTGVMAWLEFQGTNNKIERYSSVVDALQRHVVWWKTRPPIEKSATENIDRLVVTAEQILRDEMNAWRSSSATQSKMLEKQVSDSGGGSGGGGEA